MTRVHRSGSNPRNDDESWGKTIHLRHHTGGGCWGRRVSVDGYTMVHLNRLNRYQGCTGFHEDLGEMFGGRDFGSEILASNRRLGCKFAPEMETFKCILMILVWRRLDMSWFYQDAFPNVDLSHERMPRTTHIFEIFGLYIGFVSNQLYSCWSFLKWTNGTSTWRKQL